jgi:predicted amidohydrolase
MVKVAAVQMCASHILEDNLKEVSLLVKEASNLGARLIGFPEGFSLYGVSNEIKHDYVEQLGSGVVQGHLANLAAKYNMWILGGSVFIKEPDGRIYITSLVYNSNGECVARYNKINLFKAFLSHNLEYVESSFASPGRDHVVIPTPIGRLGLSICFDLRFPQLYQKLYQLGAEIISAPSAFTHITGQKHWEVLLRSRALDTFSFMFAPAQYGVHSNGLRTYGHAMIVNPWGEVIQEMHEDKSGLVVADIDIREVYQARKKIIKH